MNYKKLFTGLFAAAALLVSAVASAQAPAYGMAITLDQAKKAMTAAEAEAKKNSRNVVIASWFTNWSMASHWPSRKSTDGLARAMRSQERAAVCVVISCSVDSCLTAANNSLH